MWQDTPLEHSNPRKDLFLQRGEETWAISLEAAAQVLSERRSHFLMRSDMPDFSGGREASNPKRL